MNSLFYYIGIQILFSLALGQRTPTISHITQEQIRDIGGVVELECSVQYAQDYPILWIKISPGRQLDPLPVSTGSTLIIRDSRFSVRYDPASSTYTLQVKDIQETDAGIYQCQVIISVNNKISAEVDLQVRRPPIISDNSTRSIIVSEGQTVLLECYAGGYPKPRISWRRENNAILPTGGSTFRGNTLKINTVRKEDRGTYYCVAENGVGKGTRRNVAVEVEFAPVIMVPRPIQSQALQYDMDLECHVEAYPPPAIVWLKDGIQLANNQHYALSHFATADEYTDTTLRVITIEKRQYGVYTCKASNKLGHAEAQVKLHESIIPVCPPACGQEIYGGAVRLPHIVPTETNKTIEKGFPETRKMNETGFPDTSKMNETGIPETCKMNEKGITWSLEELMNSFSQLIDSKNLAKQDDILLLNNEINKLRTENSVLKNEIEQLKNNILDKTNEI